MAVAQPAGWVFRELVRRPSAAGLMFFGTLARLSLGMNTLALSLLILARGWGYRSVGLGVAAYAIGACLSGPGRGRLGDRLGPSRTIAILGSLNVLCSVLLAVLAGAIHQRWPVYGLAAALGASIAPIAALMRSLWSRLLADDQRLLVAAHSWETAVMETVFVVGPLLVVLVASAVSPALALLVAGAALAVGCAGLLVFLRRLHPAGRSVPDSVPDEVPSPPAVTGRGALLAGTPRLPALLVVGFLATGSIAAVNISVVAGADRRGSTGSSGILIAVLAVGGLIGGAGYGSLGETWPVAALQRILLVGLAVVALLAAVISDVFVLGVMVGLLGTMLGPMMTTQFRLVDVAAPAERKSEAFSWFYSAGQAGSAAAGALAGLLVSLGSADAGYLLAAGMYLGGALLSTVLGGSTLAGSGSR